MSVSWWQDQNISKAKKTAHYDVIIIGGGIAGFSTAYWLLQENTSLNIALIEKGLVGSGATGKNAGFITCGSVEHFNRLVSHHGEDKAQEIWQFSEKNLALLKNAIIHDEIELEFEANGSFSLASTNEEFNELKKTNELMNKLKINSEVLDEKSIQKRLGAQHFVGGIKYINDASIHPLKLLHKIKSLCLENSNFSLFENHEVFNIDQKGDEKIVKTNQRYFKAALVIMATNGYSPLLNNYFSDKIFPTRGQILATSAVPRFMEGPCYANFVLDYFRQLPTGEMIIGGFRQLQKDSEVGYSDETNQTIQKALEEFLKKHIPNVAHAQITHRWSGVMGFSVDGQPMIGSLPTDNQLFFIGGFTAHGLGLAFHTAKCLVDLIFDRKVPDFISAKRF